MAALIENISIEELQNGIKDFPYYLELKSLPRIAFGSCKERFPSKVHSKKVVGRTKIVVHHQPESRHHCCKGLLKNYPSKRGYSGLANQTKRFPEHKWQTPPPGHYNLEQVEETSSKSSYPFNITDNGNRSKFTVPAPADYAGYGKHYEVPVNMGFGTRRLIIPAVTIFCDIENKSKCFKCHCRPEGDYFHNFETRQDLCRRCMNAELLVLRKCMTDISKRVRKLKELGKYKPARWCDFHHIHKGTKVIVKKYTPAALRTKFYTENYLYAFDKLHKWYVQY